MLGADPMRVGFKRLTGSVGLVALSVGLLIPVACLDAVDETPTRATTLYSPAWSPDSKQITFDAKVEGKWAILVMNADGSGLRKLTSGTTSDFASSWSPDGRLIAFASRQGGETDIHVMNADGSGRRALAAHAGEDTYPRFSPDGSLLAFRAVRSGRSELYVMRPDGTEIRALTQGTLDIDGRYTWRPDGSALVFHAMPKGQRPEMSVPAVLYAARADGSGVEALTREERRDYNPSFAPDGSRIAVDANRNGGWESDDGGWEIFSIRPDGSDRQALTKNEVNDWGPAWSPDGTRIAYCSGLDDVYEIHVMRADGSEPRRLTHLSRP
jgi:TolB protein